MGSIQQISKLCLIMSLGLFLGLPVSHAQEDSENAEEDITEESSQEDAVGEVPADAALENEAEAAPSAPGEARFSAGFTFQTWSPFTQVTSSAVTELASASGVDSDKGDNIDENLNSDEVSTNNVAIATIEVRGSGILDDLHLDLTENTDFSRLNPFDNRVDEASRESNLENQLKKEQEQTARLRSQLQLLDFPDVFEIVFRVNEEHFVSQVTPSRDSLFINFGNSEALIRKGTEIHLETSFEEKMVGLARFDVPWTEVPIGFLGYFELTFQKPILLPLPQPTTIEDDGEDVLVDSVIIFPQFKAVGWMLEWFKSKEDGFDISGYLKFGHGNLSIGQSRKRVNQLILDVDNPESRSLFARSAEIYFSGGLLRLSYISDFFEINWAGEWRAFVLNETFNGVSSQTPVSLDVIVSLEVLYVF